MGSVDKLFKRFLTQPKDFTFDELVRLFNQIGFRLSTKGKTSGSRVVFVNKEKELTIGFHKPHPNTIIKQYLMKDILDYLKENKLIE
jgi:hypothetical protein